MNIGAAIFKILGDDATFLAALGGTKKIYPLRAAQGIDFPYLVYQTINTSANETKSGSSTIDILRVQFDLFGKSYDDLHTLADRLRALIDQYRGTVESINIDSCYYLSENPTWEDDDDAARISVDYNFRIQRAGTIGAGSGTTEAYLFDTQLFSNVTTSTLTVTTGNLPSADLDLNLSVYRDGRLLINTVDFTVSGNIITLTLQGLGENFLVKYKKS